MLTTISQLERQRVLMPKRAIRKPRSGKPPERLSKLGRVHMAVFSEDGRRVVGLLVKRPDVVGMVARPDVFLALDSFECVEGGLRVGRSEGAFDDDARKRLGLDWDACVLWAGMDARTRSGRDLGFVSDAEFDLATGVVTKFLVGDGGISRSLVGSREIPPRLVLGYSDGYMVVADDASQIGFNGGAAARAGEATARAQAAGAEVGQRVGKAAGKAVDRGTHSLGRAIGRARHAVAKAQETEGPPPAAAADIRVSEPVLQVGPPKPPTGERTYRAPKPTAVAPEKTRSEQAGSVGNDAARRVGRGLGRMGRALGSFKDEFGKASK